jgi:predicted Zn-dependent protease
MQDRQNARLMSMKPTGNGRRQSYAHVPMPRMTNTYMLAGNRDPGEIIASVKNGIYAVNFGGGQVDITSGKYVFQVTEAYKIEDGKLAQPLKGAMLIGNGPTDLNRIWNSILASAPVARTARVCPSESANRPCAWTALPSAGRGENIPLAACCAGLASGSAERSCLSVVMAGARVAFTAPDVACAISPLPKCSTAYEPDA